jgi:hypothetical protein
MALFHPALRGAGSGDFRFSRPGTSVPKEDEPLIFTVKAATEDHYSEFPHHILLIPIPSHANNRSHPIETLRLLFDSAPKRTFRLDTGLNGTAMTYEFSGRKMIRKRAISERRIGTESFFLLESH